MSLPPEPRIVLFDLETLPDLPAALRVWPQLSNFPGRTLKATISSICCFGYKVLGEDKTHCVNAWDFPSWPADKNDDRGVLEAALKVLGDADAVITQNGKSFDWKFLQTRLLIRDMPALPPTPNIDTKLIAKANLSLFSNSLKYMAEQMTDSRKMENEGWELWVKVHGDDSEAKEIMTAYCKADVDALEAIYFKLRKYVKNAPNHNLYTVGGSKNLCPNCGSSRLRSHGLRSSKTRTYRRYGCLDCGAWSSTDLNDRLPRSV